MRFSFVFNLFLLPLAGTGYYTMVIQLYCRVYAIVLAWALFYLISSFSGTLPWASCSNPWNTGEYGSGLINTVFDESTEVLDCYFLIISSGYISKMQLGFSQEHRPLCPSNRPSVHRSIHPSTHLLTEVGWTQYHLSWGGRVQKSIGSTLKNHR